MEDVFYIVAADKSTNIDGEYMPNFSNFKLVNKIGDVFGAEVEINGNTFVTGDGSLDVWDSVYLYRNIIGRSVEYPAVVPDMISVDPFVYPGNMAVDSVYY